MSTLKSFSLLKIKESFNNQNRMYNYNNPRISHAAKYFLLLVLLDVLPLYSLLSVAS